MKRVTNYSTDLYLLIYTKMARIHVKEDWEKEADENPFPSGGMMTFDGGLVYVFVSQPNLHPLPQSVGEAGKLKMKRYQRPPYLSEEGGEWKKKGSQSLPYPHRKRLKKWK